MPPNAIGRKAIVCTYILFAPEPTSLHLLSLQGHNGKVYFATFSPDGARILTASEDRTARIWNARTGEHVLTLSGHAMDLTHAAFSSDGKRVVTASLDDTVRIWDALNGKPLATLKGHRSRVITLAFSPDGKQVVTGGYDGTVTIYPTTLEHFMRMAATILRRHQEFNLVRQYCEPYLN